MKKTPIPHPPVVAVVGSSEMARQTLPQSSEFSETQFAQDDVDVCLHLLEQLPGVDYSSDFYCFGVVLFTKPEYRRIFMKRPNEETRKQFIIDATRADNGS